MALVERGHIHGNETRCGDRLMSADWRVGNPKRMTRLPSRPALSLAAALAIGALAGIAARSEPAPNARLDGFNVIMTPGHPFGSASATLALSNAKQLGARTVAVVPFLWQPNPTSPDLVRGTDMDDDELRAGIHLAHELGFTVVVKPHVWVPDSWAGEVAMMSEADWQKWFANYRRALEPIARIAAAENAEALVIATELSKTIRRPEWNELIGDTRKIFSGRTFYMAHNIEEAGQVPFWQDLDAIGVSLYPPLGSDGNGDGRRMTMRAVADRLDMLALLIGKPIVVGEVGLRSAQGAAAKPWESAEERASPPDTALQAAVLADWLKILDRPSIRGVLIWRWFTDPDAGGMTDTDFTVQGKPAERVLKCTWTRSCDADEDGIGSPRTANWK
jgi:hypothetical protein